MRDWPETITVSVTAAEYREALKARRRHRPVLGIVIYIAFLTFLSAIGVPIGALARGAFIAVVLCALWIAVTHWRISAWADRPSATVHFDAAGFDITRCDVNRRFEWSNVKRIWTTDTLVCLQLGFRIVVLPKRCFPSAEIADALADAMSNADSL